MKKLGISILLVLCVTVFMLSGCKKKVTDRCPELASSVSDAVTAFSTNPTTATCNAYKASIHDYYDGCSLITPSEKASLDAALESLDCSQF
jgi:hypothetical protein